MPSRASAARRAPAGRAADRLQQARRCRSRAVRARTRRSTGRLQKNRDALAPVASTRRRRRREAEHEDRDRSAGSSSAHVARSAHRSRRRRTSARPCETAPRYVVRVDPAASVVADRSAMFSTSCGRPPSLKPATCAGLDADAPEAEHDDGDRERAAWPRTRRQSSDARPAAAASASAGARLDEVLRQVARAVDGDRERPPRAIHAECDHAPGDRRIDERAASSAPMPPRNHSMSTRARSSGQRQQVQRRAERARVGLARVAQVVVDRREPEIVERAVGREVEPARPR